MNPEERAKLRAVAESYSDQEAVIPPITRCTACGSIITYNGTPRILPSQVRRLLAYVDELERKVPR